MTKTWVVVADADKAQIFSAPSPVGALSPEFALENQADTVGRDYADRPGRVRDRLGNNRHAMEPKKSPKRVRREKFAKDIASLLDKARTEGRFENLVLIAGPTFLGEIRHHLPEATAKLVSRSISRRAVTFDRATVQQLLSASPQV